MDNNKIDFVGELASRLHEDWRKGFVKTSGSADAERWKDIKDKAFIAALDPNNLPSYIKQEDGKFQININTDFQNLSPDWKKENLAAAEVIRNLLDHYERDLAPFDKYDEKGGLKNIYGSEEYIHGEWLKRNEWAKGGELDVPFEKLPQHEQDKDTAQLRIGQKYLEELRSKRMSRAAIRPTDFREAVKMSLKELANEFHKTAKEMKEMLADLIGPIGTSISVGKSGKTTFGTRVGPRDAFQEIESAF